MRIICIITRRRQYAAAAKEELCLAYISNAGSSGSGSGMARTAGAGISGGPIKAGRVGMTAFFFAGS